MKRKELLNYRFCIDSRKLKPGEVFVAIKGERYDGHDFVIEAVQKGASFVVVERRFGLKNEIVVENTVKFLLELSGEKIKEAFIIGVTGAAGKTFTKELLGLLIDGSFKSRGNLNTEIGLPLTILNDYKREKIAVLEYGMDKRGDIELLCNYFKPEVGIVLNIGRQHVGVAGSIENLFYGLMELADASSKVVYFAEDERMKEYLKESSKVTVSFGLEKGDIRPLQWEYSKNLKTHAFFEVFGEKLELTLNGIWHKGHLINLSAALATLNIMDYSFKPEKLNDFKFVEGRFVWHDFGDIFVIDDTYNASLVAYESAVSAMVEFPAERKLAVVGPILEQGDYSEETHKILSRLLEKLDGVLVYDGYEGSEYIQPKNVIFRSDDPKLLVEKLVKTVKPGDVILFKASRSVGMEKVLNAFRRLMGW